LLLELPFFVFASSELDRSVRVIVVHSREFVAILLILSLISHVRVPFVRQSMDSPAHEHQRARSSIVHAQIQGSDWLIPSLTPRRLEIASVTKVDENAVSRSASQNIPIVQVAVVETDLGKPSYSLSETPMEADVVPQGG
jgi:hypothetical protein